MKIIILAFVFVVMPIKAFSWDAESTTVTLDLIKKLDVTHVSLDQIKTLTEFSREFRRSPDKIPVELRDALRDLVERTAQGPAPTNQIEKGDKGLRAFTLALKLGSEPEPKVLETLVLRADLPVEYRSNALDELRMQKQEKSLEMIGEALKDSPDRDSKYLAINAFLNQKRITPEQASYLVEELNSGKSPAKVRLMLPPEIKKVYKAAAVSDRQKIDELVASGRVPLSDDHKSDLKALKAQKQ